MALAATQGQDRDEPQADLAPASQSRRRLTGPELASIESFDTSDHDHLDTGPAEWVLSPEEVDILEAFDLNTESPTGEIMNLAARVPFSRRAKDALFDVVVRATLEKLNGQRITKPQRFFLMLNALRRC